jgi:hypothetical protein
MKTFTWMKNKLGFNKKNGVDLIIQDGNHVKDVPLHKRIIPLAEDFFAEVISSVVQFDVGSLGSTTTLTEVRKMLFYLEFDPMNVALSNLAPPLKEIHDLIIKNTSVINEKTPLIEEKVESSSNTAEKYLSMTKDERREAIREGLTSSIEDLCQQIERVRYGDNDMVDSVLASLENERSTAERYDFHVLKEKCKTAIKTLKHKYKNQKSPVVVIEEDKTETELNNSSETINLDSTVV